MKKRKKLTSIILGLILLLQYIVTPFEVVASTLDNNAKGEPLLSQISLDDSNTNPDLLSFNLFFEMKKDIKNLETVMISLNDSININEPEDNNISKSTINYTTDGNKIILSEKPSINNEVKINFSIDRKVLKGVTQLKASLGDQEVSVQLPSEPTESKNDSTEPSQSSTNKSSESNTEKKLKDNEEVTAQKSKLKKTSEVESGVEPQDIRQLLEEKTISPATIIDNVKVVYVNKDGKPYSDQTNVPIDAGISIDYSWSIPNDILPLKSGDYFDFKLPDGVSIEEVSSSLGDYGTYTINSDGTVHFVFNEKVETDHDIKGTFHYNAHFDKIVVPGEIVIDTPTEENFPPSEIHIRPKYDQAIDKAGHFDKTPNPSKVIWEININRPLNTMENATLTDSMPEGTTYESVVIYPEIVGPDGEITSIDKEHPLVEGTDYSVDTNGKITFIGQYATTNKAFNIVYTTTINDKSIPKKGGTVRFKNTATLSDGKTDTHASASVQTQYKGPIAKNGPFSTGNDQTYNWNIEYNYNEKKHKAGSYIEDTMSESIELVDGSVKLYKITFDKHGKELKGEELKVGEDYQIIPNPSNSQKFKIEFLKDIDYAIKAEYRTKVKDIVDDNVLIDNSVETNTGDKDKSGGVATQQGIVKNIDGNIDYSKKEISWKIDINNAGYWMENWELNDTMSDGLIFLKDTFQIIDKTSGNKILSPDQYSLEKISGGFKVSFNSPLKEGTDHKYQIKYKTKFDTSAIDNGSGHESEIKYKNDVSMTWKDKNGGNHTNNDNQDFKPLPPFQYNGQKSGSYNATTKKITWTVAVNFNQQELTNASIVDPVLEDQNYVSGSAKIFEAIINKNGTYTLGAEVTSIMGIKVTENEDKLKVSFPNGSTKAYVLIFDTSLDGAVIDKKEYKNTATFTNNGISHDLNASITPAHQGKFVSKNGLQSKKDSNYVNWSLTINASQSTLKDVEVTDTPSSNQYVTTNDIIVYGTIIDSSGKIVKDSGNILSQGKDYNTNIQTDNSTGAQVIKIKFSSEINTAYIIEYKALITSDKSRDTVTNRAHLTATNEKTIEQDMEKYVPVINHHGRAEGSKGSITLEKVGSNKEKLKGAHFELWSINKDGGKDKLIREGDTDIHGELKLGNLRVGDYLLFETKSPEGYNPSLELINGKKITILKDSETSNFPINEIENEPTKVILKKVGIINEDGKENKNPLQGAEFTVLDSDGKIIPGYENLISNSLGVVSIEKLLPGNYSIIETKAPEGYILDSIPIKIELKRNEAGVIPEIHLERINYQGSAELIKHDSKGNPLSDAEFKVVDKEGKTIKEGLTSDKEGKVTISNLAPGDYSFVETKAPEGYVLNTEAVNFTISNETKGKPQIVVASDNFVNYQGTAELIKHDSKGNPLSDAEFKVVDKEGKTIKEGLTSDKEGKVTISNLAPGDYSFVETKAPEGYVLNTEPVNFTISSENEGQPQIVVASDNFVNYQGSAELIKHDSKGNPLSDAEFKVVDKEGKTIKEGLTSDKEGKVTISNLAPGDYSFVETKAPEGYVLNTEAVNFTISNETKGKPQIVVASDNFVNYQGTAELIKHDSKGNPLSDAEFKVVDKEGKTIKEGLTSDKEGKVTISNLAPGDYSFVETKAPEGYVLNTEPVNFTISSENEGQPQIVVASDNFVNYQGSAELIKHDSKGNPLSDAEFKVVDKEGKTIKEGLTSDKEGKVTISNLAPGDYSFVETKAPEGYVLNTEAVNFTISNETKGKPQIVVASDNFVNYQGTAELIKHDSKGNPLSDAEFKVVDKEGKTIKEGLTSDKEGKVTISNLAPGDYSFVETKAPEGYVLNTEAVNFTISNETKGKPQIVVASDNFVNYQGTAELVKVNEQGEKLSGAIFNVVDSDTDKVVLKDIKSDSSGVVIAENLKPGRYSFIETKSPKGYELSHERRSFEIKNKDEGKPKVVKAGSLINKVSPAKLNNFKLPLTGDQGSLVLVLIGMGTLIGIGVILYKKKNN